jgi:hypothetical protein
MALHPKFLKKREPKKSDHQKLIAKLDEVFSEWVRLRDCDNEGMCMCITCDDFSHWRTVDAGHFIDRDQMATRWDEQNVNAQCRKCNRFDTIRKFDHGLDIDKRHGAGTAAMLTIKSREVCSFADHELTTMINYYKREIVILREQKGMI